MSNMYLIVALTDSSSWIVIISAILLNYIITDIIITNIVIYWCIMIKQIV